ncbi:MULTISPECIES: integrase arm-type DNA-binding domain-containing protein [unclassified Duganella]|uniref:tyrosine-type recombinase/integrase n=1 Tax=unclassified Duganella TaxID=2636909 RepID=UPI00088F8DA1|nr:MULTISPECIES: integrase arm-type DNA-binding domain-containing protein [unclassified Duganella]SDH42197.1 Integrase [Duganella sp. OV458]SDK60203.1 Integrase [Duganella sp. OV510]
MAINTLTDADCRKATSNDGKLRKLFDGHGLMLAVLPSGNKVWRMAYRNSAGKQQTAVIGPYPLISLKDARERRDALRLKLIDGQDLKITAKGKPSVSLDAATASYWDGRADLTDGYKTNARRAHEMYLAPTLGKVLVRDITKDMLMDALRPMDAAGLTVYVRRVRMWASQVLEWAVQHGHCDSNPASSINSKVAFSRKKRVGFAHLPLADVHPFLERLALEEDIQSVLACKLLALTWTRTDELRRMTWEEIEGDVWRIPGKRMKVGREHLVPLSSQALELLEEMKTRSRGSKYVFPNDRTGSRPMSENAILYLIHRIGFKGKMTGHGWRKVGSTWANENEYNADHVEMQLAHTEKDDVRGTYNSAEYLKQRRVMLQDFAEWLFKAG